MSDVQPHQLVPLEIAVAYTPLGVRFWDAARDAPIGPGLLVEAWDEATPAARRTRAVLSRAGVYALMGLPGMRAVERPQGDRAPASPPFTRRFVVAVRDPAGHFLPAVFRVELPYRGIYPTASLGSPAAGSPPGVYLFSAPTRPSSGLAVARAQLIERASGRPAAHAVIELSGPAGTFYGVANAAGIAAVIFGYPGFSPTPPASPPRSAEAASEPQRWPLSARVRYEPAAQRVPPGADLPDLASLFAQAQASVRPTLSGAPAPALSVALEFGGELLLASEPGDTLLVG